ncbi:hypothetical protein OF83DRAFT_1070571 [Amylostereum chailletii]|nr:hypothetical protein OF83DRAFT_1070571 [Amylostereum chailletii]
MSTSGRSQARFTHNTSLTRQNDPTLYEQGQKQAEISIQRYHYLCAAVSKAYELTTVPADINRGQLFPRQGIIFKAYKHYNLDPVLGIKLHPREDGTIHPGDVEVYNDTLRLSWKIREAGVMYAVAESREFWNLVLNYHSKAATTGIKSWDRLFAKLKKSNFDKGLVPCMFFARESGCQDPKCQFKHDKEACMLDRERVLMKRRVVLGRPTARDISIYQTRELRAHRASQSQKTPASSLSSTALAILDDENDDDEPLEPEIQKIYDDASNIKSVCGYSECLTVKMKSQKDVTMKNCSRCQAVKYCSAKCQAADWRRHKKDCMPFEEIVENDDLWNSFGARKGTGHINIHFDED